MSKKHFYELKNPQPAIFNQSRRLVAEPAAELDLILPSDLEFEE